MTSPDRLVVSRRGRGPTIALVHGFTQTQRSWAPTVEHLADRFEVLTVDAPGHGRSASIRADVPMTAALVVEAGGPATYVGYSMGGRIVLQAALEHPGSVQRLVLVSTTAGIEDDGERATRRSEDETLAASIERDGVAAFVDRWLAGPLFATLRSERAGRADRLDNDPGGLAASLRLAGTGTMEPLWERLGSLAMPVLVVAGGLDERFRTLGGRLAAAAPHATLAVVADAGHTVHLERPTDFHAVLDDWLEATAAAVKN